MPFKPFLMIQYAALFLVMLLLMMIFPIDGSLDLKLIQPWMSQNGEFLLKKNWYLATLSHHYVKYLLILSYLSLLALWIHSFILRQRMTVRWDYAYFVSMVILSTTLIGVIKSQSAHACPWDMVVATDAAFSWNFNQIHGHCFPGGHASTGFALLVGYFIYRLSQPRTALFYLCAALIIGFAMGWAQMMRGAHFLSHNLWTAWFIWLLNILVYHLSYRTLATTVFGVKKIKTNTINPDESESE